MSLGKYISEWEYLIVFLTSTFFPTSYFVSRYDLGSTLQIYSDLELNHMELEVGVDLNFVGMDCERERMLLS